MLPCSHTGHLKAVLKLLHVNQVAGCRQSSGGEYQSNFTSQMTTGDQCHLPPLHCLSKGQPSVLPQPHPLW